MDKGNRVPTAHHTTARAKRPMELVHIDTTDPFPASRERSRYVVMFVDSDKNTVAILAVVLSAVTTEQTIRTNQSWNTATTSGSDAS